jgi:hypothetical protein
MVGDIEISFVEHLASKKVCLQPDIIQCSPGEDFQEKTIKIDAILLPMRNIANLQLKPRITRALRENTCFAQEPISTRSATKRVVEILDIKYEKADLPAIIRVWCMRMWVKNS